MVAGAGGAGGGGAGGDGTKGGTDGTDGLGGGGGGSSSAGIAGKGGDGIVIVRIYWVHDGPIDKPVNGKKYPYTGEEIVADQSEPDVYDVSGETVATNVRETAYHYVATLAADDLTWSDNTKDPVNVDWWIVPGTNSIPTPLFESVTYDGENHRVVGNLPQKTSFVDESVWCATNVGKYAYTVKLDNPVNYRWSDGSTTNQKFGWSITPRQITPQPLPTGLVYAGTNVVAATNNPNYVFVDGSVTSATNAGNYKVVFRLADPDNNCWPDGTTEDQTFWWSIARMPVDKPPVPGDDGNFTYDGTTKVAATNTVYYTLGEIPGRPGYQYAVQAKARGDYYCSAVLGENWCWKDDGSIEPYQVLWHIQQAKNEITALRLADWKLGETPKEPSITAKFGADKVKYTYWNGTKWLSDPPETNGVFYVKAFIPETTNWTSAERTKRFLIYKSFDELFTDYVDIDMPSATARGVDDYHLLVKISETIFRGFSYDRCPTGEGLAFMDLTPGQDEAPLAFDVDTWNVKGDSYVWVKLPRMAANTKIRMYWHLREGMEPPGPDAAETWSGYTGVWHFSEKIDKTAAATTPSADATGNGYAAVPTTESGNLSQMTSQPDAVVGNGRNNAADSNPKGNRLIVTNFTDCALGTNFIFSGWILLYNGGTPPCILARKNLDGEGGFALALHSDDRKKLDLYGRSTTPAVSEEIASKNMNGDWVQLTWAVCGDRYWLYSRSAGFGSYSRSGQLASPVGDDLAQLVFGGDIDGKAPSVYGAFDEFRLQPWTVSSDGPTDSQIAALTNAVNATYGNVANPASFVTHSWIVKDGIKQNYWITEPDLTKREWDVGDVPGVVIPGEPATGEVQIVYRNVFKPDETSPTLPITAGNYVAAFSVIVEGFDDLVREIPFTIVGHEPYSALGATEEGRILLANDDSRGDWGETSITNQAYWLTKYVDTICSSNYVTRQRIGGQWVYITNWVYWVETTTNSTYWVHSGESTPDPESQPYLLPNSVHVLQTTNKIDSLCGGSVLWRLENARIGNLYMEGFEDRERKSYLPWSSTSCAISSNTAVFTQAEIGNIMLRNALKGERGLETGVYSPCYTNGIGTVYCDAVNFNSTLLGDDAYANYRLVIEVATNLTTGAGLPTDENVHEIVVTTNDLNEITAETNLYKFADWKTVKVDVYQFKNGTTNHTSVSEVELNMTGGKSHENFFRLVAKVNYNVPARFRIRRTTCYEGHSLDSYGQILLDNIIASKPCVVKGATAASGWFDREKRGKQALGYENTWETPFPALGEKVFARAELDGGGSNYVTKTVMRYRERYLKQRIDPWKEVVLNPFDEFRAMEPMDLSGLPGDIEFYFISEMQAPFYRYVDYSADPDKPRGVPGYTEEIREVVNRCEDLSEETSQSRGSHWFVRLREGASDWEGLVLRTDASDPVYREIQMELISDHIWRGYFKTVDGIAGGVRYRIEPRNLQEPGSRGFSMNTNYWYAADDVQRLPASAVLKTDGTTNSWARIPCDGTTGYLMFQVDDSTKSISIVHADYQDFDNWHDARKDGDLFVGNSTEDNGKSGVSPKMQEFTEEFTRNGRPWAATPSGNESWNESFDTEASQAFANYVPFGSATTLGSWVCGPGMFVDEWYKHSDAIDGKPRRALQMEGCGKGSIQFPQTPDRSPRGLAEVSFTARLGQFINIDSDLAYAEIPSIDTMVTRDYCFMTFAAFDLNSNKDFAGDASLSLFAYYRNRKGAYEVRLEQVGAAVASDGKTVTGPSNARRLTLYRWTPDKDGKVSPTKLGEQDITFAAVKTQCETNNYTPFYISCKNETDATVVKFGIYRNENGIDKTPAVGFPYDGEISDLNSKRFYSMVYRDTNTTARLKGGTYGVLSANCDGVFLRPHVSHAPVGTTKTDKGKLVVDGNNTTVNFPEFTSCKPDLVDEDEEDPWNINPGRMNVYLDEADIYLYGLQATPVSQTLDLQVSPRGKGKWETVKSFTFDDFGEEGKSGKSCSCRLDRTTDLDMRLVVEGELDDPRTDVIVDDLKLTQWRGCDYGDLDTLSFIAPDDGNGWRTNFTFSSGWVKNEVSGGETNATVLLSAKRTLGWTTGSKASAIRSPLMDGGDDGKRGIGLGLFSFGYRNAQENARLLVQIATNNITSSALGYDTIDDNLWTTVSNVNFSAMTAAQRKSGDVSVYLGLHGVKGLMRVCVDPAVVTEVSPTNWLDQAKYGEVEITSVLCRDEPPIDLTAWWGWNLQTTDHTDRQYLVDNAKAVTGLNGLSLGLNRGIRRPEDNVEDDPETYKRQMPFVQTPTFKSNTVGEVTFRARQYELTGQNQYAEVALYGANFRPGTQDLDWHCSPADPPLARFIVSNTTYTTYTYRTKPGEDYKAFRLGVTGVKDVDYETRGPEPTQGETPVRVLIDEVLVSEAIRPEMGFRSCWPIRSQLTTAEKVLTTGRREEQPIMGDAWSVQAEIAVKLLPDEIDLRTPGHEPRVFFHWFRGESPWGFAAWKGTPADPIDKNKRGTAELKRVEGEEMVFKGSYIDAPSAVVMAEPSTAAYTYRIYQYAAEVVYWDVKGNCITGVLNSAEWTRPEWYAPLDLNAKHGGGAEGGSFAAYNILESVSPGRAWINEANIFDGKTAGNEYPADKNQYVEIAVPITQSLENWKLYYLDHNQTTNLLCVFGQSSITSSKTANPTNNYVFLTVQSPLTRDSKTLDATKGEVDGTWKTLGGTDKNGELDQTYPIGLQLIRPSGIIAHEIVLEGTNTWAGSIWWDEFSAETLVKKLNEEDPEKQWYEVGNEYGGLVTMSLGVTNLDVTAERSSSVVPKKLWWNRGVKTPGRVNAGQVIPEGYAIFPSGDMVLVNATVTGTHILQTVGEVTNSTLSVLVATPKDGGGTNITYHLDSPWFEVGEIRENGVVKAEGGSDGFVFAAGKGTSESVVTVTAAARPRKDLREKYGLGPDNPYTDAVLKWLVDGKTLKGDFAYPGNIDLPIYRHWWSGNAVTNLTLTETYWFDIDPTGSNWCYRAGTSKCPHPVYVNLPGDIVKTNIRIEVAMVITNESTGSSWSPYVLRSKTPGVDSQMYARGETNRWDSVNFKITADVINGLPLREKWVPMRYFVFKEGSFDANNRATIDIPHPFSADSLSVNYGWKSYSANPEKWSLGYRWSIDPRIAPVAIETLAPTNAITW